MLRSTVAVNQAGVRGSKNEIRHAGRPCTVVVPSRWASETAAQKGTGCLTGVWGEATQRLENGARSQRLPPMMIPAVPVLES